MTSFWRECTPEETFALEISVHFRSTRFAVISKTGGTIGAFCRYEHGKEDSCMNGEYKERRLVDDVLHKPVKNADVEF